MVQLLDPLLILALTLNFVALGVSRIRGVINAVALQGILMGAFTLLVHPEIGLRGLVLVVGTIALKGFVIPAFLVEIGVLLDLFTCVFVMGIIIHHISREFSSISTEHLTELKE